VRVLIAPDKFKGTLQAPAVASAIAEGVRRAEPDAEVVLKPLADGGEGTLEALVDAIGGRRLTATVTGPLGDAVEAPFALLDDGRAVLEVAAATGLTLVAEPRRDALRAASFGSGELIAAAAAGGLAGAGPAELEIIVGLGGSASTDGGTGAAAAAGWRFLDATGDDLVRGGGALRRLRRIDGGGAAEWLGRCRIVGACDIDNPLYGSSGAASVFGPQKGASAADVEVLDEGLDILATRIEADLGRAVAWLPGAGAAGGIGAGLAAFFNAQLRPGFELVAEAAGLADAIAEVDLVITGEGSLDASSLGGKTPIGVARLARSAGVECLALAGRLGVTAEELEAEGIAAALSLSDAVGHELAVTEARASIAEATVTLLRDRRRA